jgi:hypothetical protein
MIGEYLRSSICIFNSDWHLGRVGRARDLALWRFRRTRDLADGRRSGCDLRAMAGASSSARSSQPLGPPSTALTLERVLRFRIFLDQEPGSHVQSARRARAGIRAMDCMQAFAGRQSGEPSIRTRSSRHRTSRHSHKQALAHAAKAARHTNNPRTKQTLADRAAFNPYRLCASPNLRKIKISEKQHSLRRKACERPNEGGELRDRRSRTRHRAQVTARAAGHQAVPAFSRPFFS